MNPFILVLTVPGLKRLVGSPRGPFAVVSDEEIEGTVRALASSGVSEIVLVGLKYPRIEKLKRELSVRFPKVEFFLPEELPRKALGWLHDALRKAYNVSPHEIEEESFRIIEERVDLSGWPEEWRPVIKRVIHATGDLDFHRTLRVHPKALEVGLENLRAGKDVLVDVKMLASAINTKKLASLGGKVICELSQETSGATKTRTEEAIERVLTRENNIGMVAIGNAPSALLRAIEILDGRENPPLVIGLPVGFVRALEAKILLSLRPYPFITNLSVRGGSAAAAAVVNALLKLE